ncbi:Hypothetical predicted protein [Podarcis lilfordi]|uniref:Uncharacterized protein n=1 Tax=Podarcis lilfordi TaxID=74358 RepID=A0AA35KRE5_9SAUR|nr:Hypothetical predicted protein [Podarcis lilfordi]
MPREKRASREFPRAQGPPGRVVQPLAGWRLWRWVGCRGPKWRLRRISREEGRHYRSRPTKHHENSARQTDQICMN